MDFLKGAIQSATGNDDSGDNSGMVGDLCRAAVDVVQDKFMSGGGDGDDDDKSKGIGDVLNDVVGDVAKQAVENKAKDQLSDIAGSFFGK